MTKKQKRITVGVLVSGIMDDFTRMICKGVMRAAKRRDVDLVIFPAKYVDRDVSANRDIMYEYQYGTILSYARKQNLDAIVAATGCIGCFTTRERMEELMKQYEGIPCVLIASQLPGYDSVNFDNFSGVREGLECLIEQNHCTRIGMIGGPADNSDARERKNAFFQVMQEHGLAVHEGMYEAGDLTRNSREAFTRLLDHNPDLEAVFCINDDTALGLYEELKRRKLRIGRDIHVFGYDNIQAAAKASPPLSSVQADPAEMGENALELVLKKLRGEAVQSLVLPTRFVRRDSIGNLEEQQWGNTIDSRMIDSWFADVFYRCKHEDMQDAEEQIRQSFQALIRCIRSIYEDEEEGIWEVKGLLEQLLNVDTIAYADVDNLLIVLRRLQKMLMSAEHPYTKAQRELFSMIYQRIIRVMDQNLGVMQEQSIRDSFDMKLFVQKTLQFERGTDQSYGILLENLSWLHVKNAGIYTFEQPITHLVSDPFRAPEELYLKAVLRAGKVQLVPAIEQKVRLEDLFTENRGIRQDCMVLFPLFVNETLQGVILCEMSESIFESGEFLVNHLSSAAKMISLLRANQKIQQELEESLAVLRENNIVLDNLSKSDSLTGILNRRGLYEEGQQIVRQCHQQGRDVLVVYVDMNNLKIINDRYGHEEGDFSLKTIADRLKEVSEQEGVAGRIGGDEFACIRPYDGEEDGQEILERLYASFSSFNENSEKEYNVTVSAGAYVLKPGTHMTLEEALSAADERLYEVKKFRSKEVSKLA